MECAADLHGHELFQAPGLKRLSDDDFQRLSSFIHKELGIKMPPAKKALLESRLQKRLRALGLKGFTEYCDLLFSPEGLSRELVQMLDLVTTNKTDFFRESHHFDFLSRTVLPVIISETGPFVSVWSAGCSTGEEPYTISMVMSDFASSQPSIGLDFSVLATDISTRVLEYACKGVYKEERIAPVPEAVKRRYFLRSKDSSRELVRVCPEIRGKARFTRLNLMDETFPIEGRLDIIFCRNVIIYFNKETQERLFSKFCEYLRPGGYLFLGHSETLSGLGLPLKKVAASVYVRY
ncbi:MAG TPA: chemotaxis protein CheR [Deltaproteobacteria bacterium]|nr:MAG: chemotaxis protein CheR [Deltaproteobacteria bacterium GWA2_55_82]OIJ74823.1 MAG: chemotaxis protein CheR [Deltaproteobacteria bacterium GWC2_55_46]HBG47532.1 chemotaxis protein CheR [Deltaproteobacteria bacterium]HCY11548.1 chemotaxis protein CheR [Deltaproteobacteria bacterium]